MLHSSFAYKIAHVVYLMHCTQNTSMVQEQYQEQHGMHLQ